MSRRNRTKDTFDESLLVNNRTYVYYMDRFAELSMCSFDWKKVPDTINVRFLEQTLYNEGRAVFFKDEVMGYLGLQVANNGPLSVYREPIDFRAYGINGYQKFLTNKDGVIIYNNMIRRPSIGVAKLYARRLYNYDRIIDVNANAQKTPVLLQCDEEQRLTLLNLYKEYDGNAPVIHGTKNLDLKGSITVVSTGAPYIADRLMELKVQTWNEAMTYLGIESVTEQKRERMIVSEARQGMGTTMASRFSRLEARRTAAEQINKMFGLNIEVDFREDYRDYWANPELNEMMQQAQKKDGDKDE